MSEQKQDQPQPEQQQVPPLAGNYPCQELFLDEVDPLTQKPTHRHAAILQTPNRFYIDLNDARAFLPAKVALANGARGAGEERRAALHQMLEMWLRRAAAFHERHAAQQAAAQAAAAKPSSPILTTEN